MASAEGSGSRTVFCVKLGRELPGLDAPPWPGPLGQRIYEQVSAEAWAEWEERMKMILNEYRLLPFQRDSWSPGRWKSSSSARVRRFHRATSPSAQRLL